MYGEERAVMKIGEARLKSRKLEREWREREEREREAVEKKGREGANERLPDCEAEEAAAQKEGGDGEASGYEQLPAYEEGKLEKV